MRFFGGLIDRLPGGFARNVTVLAGATALGQGMAILAAPVLTRLYTPDDFGVLGVYASLLGVLATVATLRYELAIPLPEKDEDAAALLVLCLAIVPAVSFLVATLLYLSQPEFLRWIGAPFLKPYLWLLPMGLLLTGTYQTFAYWSIRAKAFPRIAQTKLVQGVAGALLPLCLFPFGPIGLLLGNIGGQAAGVTRLISLARKHDRASFTIVTWTAAVRGARRYRRFPQFSAMAGLANTAASQAPILLFAAFFNPFVVGQFVLVHRMAAWPLHLFSHAIAQVYWGHATEARRSSHDEFSRLYFRLTFGLAGIAIMPGALLALVGPWLFMLVFGEDWVVAGKYSQYLAIMLCAQFVVSPLSATLSILERNSWLLAWNGFRAIVVLFCVGAAGYFGANDIQTIACYSASMTLCYLCRWVMDVAAIHRDAVLFQTVETPA